MTRQDRNTQDRVAHEIESLRDYRNRPDRSVGLSRDLAKLARTYKKAGNGLGELTDLWQELAPKDLQEGVRLEKLSRGVLTISVSDASRRYLLDRALRSGLRRELIKHAKISLRDVRIFVERPKKSR